MYDTTTFSPRFDYSRLRGKIREVLKTEGCFAEKIGRTQNFLTKVWKGETYFNQEDINIGASALGIETDNIGYYFFCTLSSQSENN